MITETPFARTPRRLVRVARRWFLNSARGPALAQASRLRAERSDDPVSFLVSFPAPATEVGLLVRWLPLLERLDRHAPVAILTGDVETFRLVSARTALPCYIGFGAGQPEFVAQQLGTRVMLYLEQSNFNLREAGFHDIFHVFLGTPGEARANWLNNRLRLFDDVLVPDAECTAWLEQRLLAYDVGAHVHEVGSGDKADGAGAATGRAVTESGVDAEAAVSTLLGIAADRDAQVSARNEELARQGIVLRKGGDA